MMQIQSGISIREDQVRKYLKGRNFKGEYLLVSTKPDSIYSNKLTALKEDQKLIVDLYTPIFLEKELTLSKWKPQDWLTRFLNKEMVKKFLKRGNHFLVANHRQREYWLKTAQSLGVALETNDISVFPTGGSLTINHQPSTIHNRKVVLWFGGIYPWMDPKLLVEAFSQVSSKFPEWKLRFLGGFHPDTGYTNLYQKVELVAKSKIPNDQLEFVSWQPEKELNKYFQDVAFAVHLAKSTPEDYCAHRVRLLTLLEAGIPIITGGKDAISDLLVNMKAGIKINKVNLGNVLKEVISSEIDYLHWAAKTKEVQGNFIRNELDIRMEGLVE